MRHTVHVVSDEEEYLLRRELLPRTHVHPTSGGCDGHLGTLHRKGQRTGTVARVETEACEPNTERSLTQLLHVASMPQKRFSAAEVMRYHNGAGAEDNRPVST